MLRCLLLTILCVAASHVQAEGSRSVRAAVFSVDATPPLGTPISYGPAEEVMDPLSCRGVVLLGDQPPIVLCAVDWLALRNGAHDAFRVGLAKAVGTSPDRVAVHVLHQHDAPSYDFDAEMLLDAHGRGYPADFCRETIANAASAARSAMSEAKPVTHIRTGTGRVDQVASNRRVIGSDGTVVHNRWSSVKNAEVRAAPEGIIDPDVRMVSLYSDDDPLVVMTWYATHPQSYYTRGRISSDFVGLARQLTEQKTKTFHLHFNGAGGNITAGKYNDGSPANRPVLAKRLAEGMALAWNDGKKTPITAADIDWHVEQVALPIAEDLDEQTLTRKLWESSGGGASKLAWVRRRNHGHEITLSCLSLGDVRVLHMPGELFIEYQLAAQAMRPELFVCMAAYGDGGPGYIGTAAAYPQKGYEVGSPSNVAPGVENVLVAGMRRLLGVQDSDQTRPSDWTDRYPRIPSEAR